MWKFFAKEKNKPDKKRIPDYKQELVIKHGTQQLRELAKKGLEIRIALL